MRRSNSLLSLKAQVDAGFNRVVKAKPGYARYSAHSIQFGRGLAPGHNTKTRLGCKCGTTARVVDSGKAFWVRCPKCSKIGPKRDTENAAVMAWHEEITSK